MSGKAVSHDDIPLEVWKFLEETAARFLTSLLNNFRECEDV